MTEIDTAVIFDGLDAALIGFGRQHAGPVLAVYSMEKIVKALMDRDGMTEEDAGEYYYFNIECLWAGEQTPLIITEKASYKNDVDESDQEQPLPDMPQG